MSLADQYWAAAATNSGGAGHQHSHSRRGSNGSTLFNAYDDLGEDENVGTRHHPHHVLGQLDEEDDSGVSSPRDDAYSMSPISPRQHGRTGSLGRSQGANQQHRRSASLKTVVGSNGKVIPGAPGVNGSTTNGTAAASGGAVGAAGAAALLGAVKK